MQPTLDPNALPFLKAHMVPEKHCFQCFTGQHPNERAFLLINRHWIIDVMLTVGMLFWLVLPVAIYIAIDYFFPKVLTESNRMLAGLLIVLCMLFVWLRYYVRWIDERLDYVVLTDRRIVDINQNRLFNRQVTEASLAQIQDVKTKISGIIGTFLRYGDIVIETAGENANIDMNRIGHPQTVSSQILKIRDEFLESRAAQGMHEQTMGGP